MTEDKKSFPMTVNPVSDLDICRHVCNLMRKRHVTFEDCAEHIGADVDEFVDWLNGLGTIPPSYLVPLAEFLGVSVAALLIPDTKSEEDCFPLDRRPMLRLRQYAYLAQEVSLDDSLMAVCRDAWKVEFENVAIPFTRDVHAADSVVQANYGDHVEDALVDAVAKGVLSHRACSTAALADDEYDGLVNAVENTSLNVYCDKPCLGMNLTHEYEDVMSKVPAGWALRFLKRQAHLSYINAHRNAFAAPSEDGDWMTTLIASGWHPTANDFDCGCTTDAPASEDSASVSCEDVEVAVSDFDEDVSVDDVADEAAVHDFDGDTPPLEGIDWDAACGSEAKPTARE
jgi:hypothetical protein